MKIFIIFISTIRTCSYDGKQYEFDQNKVIQIPLECDETIKSIEITPELPEGLNVGKNFEITGSVNHTLPTTEYKVNINGEFVSHFNLTISRHSRELDGDVSTDFLGGANFKYSGTYEKGWKDTGNYADTWSDFNDESKKSVSRITTYVRGSFIINDISKYTRISLKVSYSDGVIFYVNGEMVYKKNIDGDLSKIGIYTPKSRTIALTNQVITVSSNFLRYGKNWLGIEIHRADSNPSDLSFSISEFKSITTGQWAAVSEGTGGGEADSMIFWSEQISSLNWEKGKMLLDANTNTYLDFNTECINGGYPTPINISYQWPHTKAMAMTYINPMFNHSTSETSVKDYAWYGKYDMSSPDDFELIEDMPNGGYNAGAGQKFRAFSNRLPSYEAVRWEFKNTFAASTNGKCSYRMAENRLYYRGLASTFICAKSGSLPQSMQGTKIIGNACSGDNVYGYEYDLCYGFDTPTWVHKTDKCLTIKDVIYGYKNVLEFSKNIEASYSPSQMYDSITWNNTEPEITLDPVNGRIFGTFTKNADFYVEVILHIDSHNKDIKKILHIVSTTLYCLTTEDGFKTVEYGEYSKISCDPETSESCTSCDNNQISISSRFCGRSGQFGDVSKTCEYKTPIVEYDRSVLFLKKDINLELTPVVYKYKVDEISSTCDFISGNKDDGKLIFNTANVREKVKCIIKYKNTDKELNLEMNVTIYENYAANVVYPSSIDFIPELFSSYTPIVDGAAINWEISPALKSGLYLNKGDGSIYGTITDETVKEFDYTVTIKSGETEVKSIPIKIYFKGPKKCINDKDGFPDTIISTISKLLCISPLLGNRTKECKNINGEAVWSDSIDDSNCRSPYPLKASYILDHYYVSNYFTIKPLVEPFRAGITKFKGINLPNEIELNDETGIITGRFDIAGSYDIKIIVSDEHEVDMSFTLIISPVVCTEIDWPETEVGKAATISCPSDKTGFKYRVCQLDYDSDNNDIGVFSSISDNCIDKMPSVFEYKNIKSKYYNGIKIPYLFPTIEPSYLSGFTFKAENLPDGLEIDKNGIISGTPTTSKSYNTKITITKDNLEKSFEITIEVSNPESIVKCEYLVENFYKSDISYILIPYCNMKVNSAVLKSEVNGINVDNDGSITFNIKAAQTLSLVIGGLSNADLNVEIRVVEPLTCSYAKSNWMIMPLTRTTIQKPECNNELKSVTITNGKLLYGLNALNDENRIGIIMGQTLYYEKESSEVTITFTDIYNQYSEYKMTLNPIKEIETNKKGFTMRKTKINEIIVPGDNPGLKDTEPYWTNMDIEGVYDIPITDFESSTMDFSCIYQIEGEVCKSLHFFNSLTKYTGLINIEVEGTYSFTLIVDDNAMLYFDDMSIAKSHSKIWSDTATFSSNVKKGYHAIGVLYFTAGSPNSAVFKWKKPGDSSYQTFDPSIIISDLIPVSRLDYQYSEYIIEVGKSIKSLLPKVFGLITKFEISPSLPTGINFNNATGEISGSTNKITSFINYIITATNGKDILSTTLPIATVDINSLTNNGLIGEYYSISNVKCNEIPNYSNVESAYKKIDVEINHEKSNELWNGLTSEFKDNFVIHWYGYIKIEIEGNYKFRIEAYDSVILKIDDKEVLSFYDCSIHDKISSLIELKSGMHNIDIIYWKSNTEDYTSFVFYYERAGTSSQLVTSDILYFASTNRLEYERSVDRLTRDSEIINNKPILSYSSTTLSDYNYRIKPTLPNGMIFNEENGEISGTPKDLISKQVYTITATNKNNKDEVINSKITISVIYYPIPNNLHYENSIGLIGNSIKTIEPTLESGEYGIYKLENGNLPNGLELNSENGNINGIAKESGVFTIKISYENSGGKTTSNEFTITINGCEAEMKFIYLIYECYDNDFTLELRSSTSLSLYYSQYSPSKKTTYTFLQCINDNELKLSITSKSGQGLKYKLYTDHNLLLKSGRMNDNEDKVEYTFSLNTNSNPIITYPSENKYLMNNYIFISPSSIVYGANKFELKNPNDLPETLSFDDKTGEISGYFPSNELDTITLRITASNLVSSSSESSVTITKILLCDNNYDLVSIIMTSDASKQQTLSVEFGSKTLIDYIYFELYEIHKWSFCLSKGNYKVIVGSQNSKQWESDSNVQIAIGNTNPTNYRLDENISSKEYLINNEYLVTETDIYYYKSGDSIESGWNTIDFKPSSNWRSISNNDIPNSKGTIYLRKSINLISRIPSFSITGTVQFTAGIKIFINGKLFYSKNLNSDDTVMDGKTGEYIKHIIADSSIMNIGDNVIGIELHSENPDTEHSDKFTLLLQYSSSVSDSCIKQNENVNMNGPNGIDDDHLINNLIDGNDETEYQISKSDSDKVTIIMSFNDNNIKNINSYYLVSNSKCEVNDPISFELYGTISYEGSDASSVWNKIDSQENTNWSRKTKYEYKIINNNDISYVFEAYKLVLTLKSDGESEECKLGLALSEWGITICETKYCPSQVTENDKTLNWPETKGGNTATIECGKGYTGKQTSSCSIEGKWESSDRSNCKLDLQPTSLSYKEVKGYSGYSFTATPIVDQGYFKLYRFKGNNKPNNIDLDESTGIITGNINTPNIYTYEIEGILFESETIIPAALKVTIESPECKESNGFSSAVIGNKGKSRCPTGMSGYIYQLCTADSNGPVWSGIIDYSECTNGQSPLCSLDITSYSVDINAQVLISPKCEGTVTSIKIVPSLPSGIKYLGNGLISGSSAYSTPPIVYTMRLNSVNNGYDIVTFTLEITGEISGCSYGFNELKIVTNSDIKVKPPRCYGSVSSYMSSTLPNGLILNSDGSITGQTSETVESKEITVVISNSRHSTTTTFSLTVVSEGISNNEIVQYLDYPYSHYSLFLNEEVNISPINSISFGNWESTLPNDKGLTFSNGIISGKVSEASTMNVEITLITESVTIKTTLSLLFVEISSNNIPKGLIGEYYTGNNINCNENPINDINTLIKSYERIDSDINHEASDSYWSGLNNEFKNNFVVVWNGYLEIPESTNYIFYVKVTDSIDITLGEQKISTKGCGIISSTTEYLSLEKGLIPLKIVYWKSSPNSKSYINIKWSYTSQQIPVEIKSSFFYHSSKSQFDMTYSYATYDIGNAINDNKPIFTSISSNNFVSFNSYPSLPNGMSVTNEGIIIGTSLVSVSNQKYIIEGKTSNDNPTFIHTLIQFQVNDNTIPIGLSYSKNEIKGKVLESIKEITATLISGKNVKYSCNDLPNGLSIDISTGRIYGIPLESFNNDVTIHCINSAGETSITIHIEISGCDGNGEVLSIYVSSMNSEFSINLKEGNNVLNVYYNFDKFTTSVYHNCLSQGDYQLAVTSTAYYGPSITLKNSGKYVYKEYKVKDGETFETISISHTHSNIPVLNYIDIPVILQAYTYVDYMLDITNGANSLIFSGLLPSTIQVNEQTGRLYGYFDTGIYSFNVIASNDKGSSIKLTKTIQVVSCNSPNYPMLVNIQTGESGNEMYVELSSIETNYFVFSGLEINNNYVRSYCLSDYEKMKLVIGSSSNKGWTNSKVSITINKTPEQLIEESFNEDSSSKKTIYLYDTSDTSITSNSEWCYYDGNKDTDDWMTDFTMNSDSWPKSKPNSFPFKTSVFRLYRRTFSFETIKETNAYITIDCTYQGKIIIYINSHEIFKYEGFDGTRSAKIKMGLGILKLGMNYVAIKVETANVHSTTKDAFNFVLNYVDSNDECTNVNVYDGTMEGYGFCYNGDGSNRELKKDKNANEGGKYLIDNNPRTKLYIPVTIKGKLLSGEVFFKDMQYVYFNKYIVWTANDMLEQRSPKKWEIRGSMKHSVTAMSGWTDLVHTVEDGNLPLEPYTPTEFYIDRTDFKAYNAYQFLSKELKKDEDGLQLGELAVYICKPKFCLGRDGFPTSFPGSTYTIPCISETTVSEQTGVCQENGQWSISECKVLDIDFSYNEGTNSLVFGSEEKSYTPTLTEGKSFDSFKYYCTLPLGISFDTSNGRIYGSSFESGSILCTIEGNHQGYVKSIVVNITVSTICKEENGFSSANQGEYGYADCISPLLGKRKKICLSDGIWSSEVDDSECYGVVYSSSSYLFYINQNVMIRPTLYGTNTESYTFEIDKTLPSGFNIIDPNTGEISGKPTSVNKNTKYLITVSSDSFENPISIELSIEVKEEAKDNTVLEYPKQDYEATIYQQFETDIPNTNGDIYYFEIDPELPYGLSIERTGQIIGLVTIPYEKKEYTIKAVSVSKNVTASIFITIENAFCEEEGWPKTAVNNIVSISCGDEYVGNQTKECQNPENPVFSEANRDNCRLKYPTNFFINPSEFDLGIGIEANEPFTLYLTPADQLYTYSASEYSFNGVTVDFESRSIKGIPIGEDIIKNITISSTLETTKTVDITINIKQYKCISDEWDEMKTGETKTIDCIDGKTGKITLTCPLKKDPELIVDESGCDLPEPSAIYPSIQFFTGVENTISPSSTTYVDSFELTDESILPDGLVVEKNGIIHGSAKLAGNFKIKLKLKNSKYESTMDLTVYVLYNGCTSADGFPNTMAGEIGKSTTCGDGKIGFRMKKCKAEYPATWDEDSLDDHCRNLPIISISENVNELYIDLESKTNDIIWNNSDEFNGLLMKYNFTLSKESEGEINDIDRIGLSFNDDSGKLNGIPSKDSVGTYILKIKGSVKEDKTFYESNELIITVKIIQLKCETSEDGYNEVNIGEKSKLENCESGEGYTYRLCSLEKEPKFGEVNDRYCIPKFEYNSGNKLEFYTYFKNSSKVSNVINTIDYYQIIEINENISSLVTIDEITGEITYNGVNSDYSTNENEELSMIVIGKKRNGDGADSNNLTVSIKVKHLECEGDEEYPTVRIKETSTSSIGCGENEYGYVTKTCQAIYPGTWGKKVSDCKSMVSISYEKESYAFYIGFSDQTDIPKKSGSLSLNGYKIMNGELPKGLSITKTGVISGKPEVSGEYKISVSGYVSYKEEVFYTNTVKLTLNITQPQCEADLEKGYPVTPANSVYETKCDGVSGNYTVKCSNARNPVWLNPDYSNCVPEIEYNELETLYIGFDEITVKPKSALGDISTYVLKSGATFYITFNQTNGEFSVNQFSIRDKSFNFTVIAKNSKNKESLPAKLQISLIQPQCKDEEYGTTNAGNSVEEKCPYNLDGKIFIKCSYEINPKYENLNESECKPLVVYNLKNFYINEMYSISPILTKGDNIVYELLTPRTDMTLIVDENSGRINISSSIPQNFNLSIRLTVNDKYTNIFTEALVIKGIYCRDNPPWNEAIYGSASMLPCEDENDIGYQTRECITISEEYPPSGIWSDSEDKLCHSNDTIPTLDPSKVNVIFYITFYDVIMNELLNEDDFVIRTAIIRSFRKYNLELSYSDMLINVKIPSNRILSESDTLSITVTLGIDSDNQLLVTSTIFDLVNNPAIFQKEINQVTTEDSKVKGKSVKITTSEKQPEYPTKLGLKVSLSNLKEELDDIDILVIKKSVQTFYEKNGIILSLNQIEVKIISKRLRFLLSDSEIQIIIHIPESTTYLAVNNLAEELIKTPLLLTSEIKENVKGEENESKFEDVEIKIEKSNLDSDNNDDGGISTTIIVVIVVCFVVVIIIIAVVILLVLRSKNSSHAQHKPQPKESKVKV